MAAALPVKLTMSQVVAQMLKMEDGRVQTDRFVQALRQAIGEDWYKERPHDRIVPDAFLVDEKAKEVVVYEIEDTHRLTPEKLDLIIDYLYSVDEFGWSLRCVVMDRYGGHRQELDLDAFAQVLGVLAGRVHGEAGVMFGPPGGPTKDLVEWTISSAGTRTP